MNKHTGLEDPLFSKYGHEGNISSKEILWICMFRTPFSCGYYQQHIFCETKIILSCLFLLEAHGLEYLYYRPIIIKYHDNTSLHSSRFLSFSKRLRKSHPLPTSPQFFGSPQACSFARPLFVRLFDLRTTEKGKESAATQASNNNKHCVCKRTTEY